MLLVKLRYFWTLSMTEAGSVFSICPSRTNSWGKERTELDGGGTVTEEIIFPSRRRCVITPDSRKILWFLRFSLGLAACRPQLTDLSLKQVKPHFLFLKKVCILMPGHIGSYWRQEDVLHSCYNDLCTKHILAQTIFYRVIEAQTSWKC